MLLADDDQMIYSEYYLLSWMAYFMILMAGITMVLLLTGFKAAYGRYSQTWTPFSTIRVPVKLAWFLQESPSFIIPAYYLCTSYSTSQTPNITILALFTIHYFHRTLIYPFRIKQGKNTPLAVFIPAFVFCTYNGYMQSLWHIKFADYDSLPSFAGLALFITGLVINIHSDSLLLNLRKDGDDGYKIPTGGLFEYVSGANFFGESLEWIGYAIAARSLPAAAFALFTVCNIGPRACHHHRWYMKKFEDYPKDRKAFIPFIL